jgi:hypothetical protein
MEMATDLIHDRGRGPEIVGTRITVYDLLTYFLDPTATEAFICRMYKLTPEQVAAGRAFVFHNLDSVLAGHLRIEERLAAGNPPEVIERAAKTRATIQKFKDWLAQREREAAQDRAADAMSGNGPNASDRFPSFREWLAQQESRPEKGS